MSYGTYVNDCTKFMQRLIQTPSVNGVQNEKAVVKVVVNEADKLGIPAVVGFGPSGEGFHLANEYAEVESLAKSLEALIKLASKMVG